MSGLSPSVEKISALKRSDIYATELDIQVSSYVEYFQPMKGHFRQCRSFSAGEQWDNEVSLDFVYRAGLEGKMVVVTHPIFKQRVPKISIIWKHEFKKYQADFMVVNEDAYDMLLSAAFRMGKNVMDNPYAVQASPPPKRTDGVHYGGALSARPKNAPERYSDALKSAEKRAAALKMETEQRAEAASARSMRRPGRVPPPSVSTPSLSMPIMTYKQRPRWRRWLHL